METNGNNRDMTAPCILLVEDYEPNILVATYILESLGFQFKVATNGEDALHHLRHHRSDYCLVLMDVQMPKLDGLEVTRIIRSEEKQHALPPIPIIAMTAFAMNEDRLRCIEAGMDNYISKPFRIESLATILGHYVKVDSGFLESV